MIVFLILYHDNDQQPYMLKGKRPDVYSVISTISPKAPRHIKKGKTRASAAVIRVPRLGHHVGDKLGRKLSSVEEEKIEGE